MRHPIKVGLSFGLTSGIITTLGLIIGLDVSTHSKLAVIGGILTIAVADALSDALGIHISEESEEKHTIREIWEATLSTFLFKFIFAASFIIFILFLEPPLSIMISILWGLSLVAIFSYYISRGEEPLKIVLEHLIIAVIVVISSYYIGIWIGEMIRS